MGRMNIQLVFLLIYGTIYMPDVASEEGRYLDHHPVGNTCADIRSHIFQIIDIY